MREGRVVQRNVREGDVHLIQVIVLVHILSAHLKSFNFVADHPRNCSRILTHLLSYVCEVVVVYFDYFLCLLLSCLRFCLLQHDFYSSRSLISEHIVIVFGGGWFFWTFVILIAKFIFLILDKIQLIIVNFFNKALVDESINIGWIFCPFCWLWCFFLFRLLRFWNMLYFLFFLQIILLIRLFVVFFFGLVLYSFGEVVVL